jgi:hypothetical protein
VERARARHHSLGEQARRSTRDFSRPERMPLTSAAMSSGSDRGVCPRGRASTAEAMPEASPSPGGRERPRGHAGACGCARGHAPLGSGAVGRCARCRLGPPARREQCEPTLLPSSRSPSRGVVHHEQCAFQVVG